jgi:hypothetical protein
MPHAVRLAHPPAGFVASAFLPGGPGWIQVLGLHTSDEGLVFTRMLEGCDAYLAGRPKVERSQIDHLLAVIDPNCCATVYLNELVPTAKIQVKAKKDGMRAGEPVMIEDIADIVEIELGVEVPPDSGIVYMFSWGWRKALFFDFRPLGPNPTPRTYSLSAALAGCQCRLAFSERFSLDDAQWERLINQRWFPFVGLKLSTVNEMIAHCAEGWDLIRLQPRLVEECKELAPEFAESCGTSDLFRPHADAIATAARHVDEGEWFSAASILYPRIEGILRGYYAASGSTGHTTQERFLTAALNGAVVGRHGYCLLLLDRFDQYLKRVIFPPFDQTNPAGVSRHTIAHGVVDPAECDEKSVVLALLSLHHLFHALNPPEVKA